LELVEDITEMEDDGSIKIEREICWYMSFFVIHLGEGNDCGDAVVDLERPLGKKASKERERERERAREHRLWRERDRVGGFKWIDGSEEEIA